MLDLGINIWCIGAAALGLLAGYLFAYSSRQEKPTGTELAALFGTVLGGTALTLIDKFKECAAALPVYVIGVTIGYLAYILLLRMNWAVVEHLKARHGYTQAPLFPRTAADPCSRNFSNSCDCRCHTPTDTNTPHQ